jgi:hypothetical protein
LKLAEMKTRILGDANFLLPGATKISANSHGHCLFVQQISSSLYHDVVHNLYNSVSQKQCNDSSCPTMSANSHHTFVWSSSVSHDTIVSSSKYIDNLAGMVESNEGNRAIYLGAPSEDATSAKNFKKYLAHFADLIRHCIIVVVHIGYAHHKTLSSDEFATLLSCCYRLSILRRLYEGNKDVPNLVDPKVVKFIHGLLDLVENAMI